MYFKKSVICGINYLLTFYIDILLTCFVFIFFGVLNYQQWKGQLFPEFPQEKCNRDKTPKVQLPELHKQKNLLDFCSPCMYTIFLLLWFRWNSVLCKMTAVIGYTVLTYVARRVHCVWGIVCRGFKQLNSSPPILPTTNLASKPEYPRF